MSERDKQRVPDSHAQSRASAVQRRDVLATTALSTLPVGAAATAAGESTAQITGTVENAAGDGIAGVRVIALDTGGSPFQVGTLTDVSGTLAPGGSLSVTVDVAANSGGFGNITWGAVGSLSGDVYGVASMDGAGTGTITIDATIPADADGDQVVWSWFPKLTAQGTRKAFRTGAAEGNLDQLGADERLVLGTVGAGNSPSLSDTTAIERYPPDGAQRTDADGTYAIELPGASTYTVVTREPERRPGAQTVEIGADGVRRVDFTLAETEPRPPVIPGASARPKDPDGDGLYEDVRGDDSFDILDVQALFDNLDDSTLQEYAGAFNFSNNNSDEVTILDVQALFNELQE